MGPFISHVNVIEKYAMYGEVFLKCFSNPKYAMLRIFSEVLPAERGYKKITGAKSHYYCSVDYPDMGNSPKSVTQFNVGKINLKNDI